MSYKVERLYEFNFNQKNSSIQYELDENSNFIFNISLSFPKTEESKIIKTNIKLTFPNLCGIMNNKNELIDIVCNDIQMNVEEVSESPYFYINYVNTNFKIQRKNGELSFKYPNLLTFIAEKKQGNDKNASQSYIVFRNPISNLFDSTKINEVIKFKDLSKNYIELFINYLLKEGKGSVSIYGCDDESYKNAYGKCKKCCSGGSSAPTLCTACKYASCGYEGDTNCS